GNGEARRQALGSRYQAVQDRVNQILEANSSSAASDIDRLAHEVINGKYGNGEARRQALGSRYQAVQ
ncbi:hypothetical protein QP568_11160, partial [Propionimicrobium lymphophilum]|nr:hypothetical protein [Propionimicrobium lymphophilum]